MDLDCLAMTKLKKSRTLYTEKSVYFTNTNMNINDISCKVGFFRPGGNLSPPPLKNQRKYTPPQFKKKIK